MNTLKNNQNVKKDEKKEEKEEKVINETFSSVTTPKASSLSIISSTTFVDLNLYAASNTTPTLLSPQMPSKPSAKDALKQRYISKMPMMVSANISPEKANPTVSLIPNISIESKPIAKASMTRKGTIINSLTPISTTSVINLESFKGSFVSTAPTKSFGNKTPQSKLMTSPFVAKLEPKIDPPVLGKYHYDNNTIVNTMTTVTTSTLASRRTSIIGASSFANSIINRGSTPTNPSSIMKVAYNNSLGKFPSREINSVSPSPFPYRKDSDGKLKITLDENNKVDATNKFLDMFSKMKTLIGKTYVDPFILKEEKKDSNADAPILKKKSSKRINNSPVESTEKEELDKILAMSSICYDIENIKNDTDEFQKNIKIINKDNPVNIEQDIDIDSKTVNIQDIINNINAETFESTKFNKNLIKISSDRRVTIYQKFFEICRECTQESNLIMLSAGGTKEISIDQMLANISKAKRNSSVNVSVNLNVNTINNISNISNVSNVMAPGNVTCDATEKDNRLHEKESKKVTAKSSIVSIGNEIYNKIHKKNYKKGKIIEVNSKHLGFNKLQKKISKKKFMQKTITLLEDDLLDVDEKVGEGDARMNIPYFKNYVHKPADGMRLILFTDEDALSDAQIKPDMDLDSLSDSNEQDETAKMYGDETQSKIKRFHKNRSKSLLVLNNNLTVYLKKKKNE